MSKSAVMLKDTLERLYDRYNHRDCINPDPLQFVYRYSEPADMEIAAFLASSLAYGRVEQIEKSLTDLFGQMGERPYEFVRDFDVSERERLSGFKHRFTTGENICDLLELLKEVLRKFGSIEQFFARGYNPQDTNILGTLSKFCGSLCAKYASKHGGHISRGVRYLLSSPDRGSACKRLNLFLRWMVREDDVDTGLWKSIDTDKLIVPVDVHIGRLCRILGLYDRKTVSLSAAVEITKSFAEVEPDDPVKYDFALSRIGILEDCSGSYRLACENCELFDLCRSREWE